MEPNPEPEPEPMETTDQLPTPATVVLSPKKKIPQPEIEGLEEEVDPELPPLKNDWGMDQAVTGGGFGVRLDADVRTGESGDDAEIEKMRNIKRVVIPDSDAASIGEPEGGLGVGPSGRDGMVAVGEGNGSGEVEDRGERDERIERKDTFAVWIEGRETEEKTFSGFEGEKAEVEGTTVRGMKGSGTACSMEDGGKSTARTGTKATPNQDVFGGRKESNRSHKTAGQTLSADMEEINNANASDSTMEVGNTPVVSAPQATDREDDLSLAMTMAQKAVQLSTGNTAQSFDEPKALKSTSEKEDITMKDEDSLLVEATEASTTRISDTQLDVAPSQPRVIPDSDEEDELSSTKTSPIKHQETSSKDINLPNAPKMSNLAPKKLKPPIANPPSSSPHKGTITPIQPINTPTKPKITTSSQPHSQLPSSPAITPPIFPKRKLPPPPLTTNDSIIRAELKAIKLASLQSRNASLIAEISAKKAQLEEVTKGLEGPAEETVKRHIRLLHEYNDMRDVGQGLLGLVADNRGVRVGELYEEFGVGLKD